MKCQYCGENKKLIKAHIIPESFFKPLRTDKSDVLYLMNDLLGEFPKKSPIEDMHKQLIKAKLIEFLPGGKKRFYFKVKRGFFRWPR